VLKVGVIGLGTMGRLHLQNCIQMENVEVVAVADSSKRALMKAKSLGVSNLYSDYHELLESSSAKMDAAIIALPNHLHFGCIQSAFESGLHVFVEKPMANTLEECENIVKLEKKHGRRLMVGYYMRFIRFIEKMREIAESGELGDLEVVTLEEVTNGPFSHPAIPRPVSEWWFTPKEVGGGVVVDLGSHLIDMFRFFAGDAEVMYSSLSHKFDLPMEDGAIVILGSPQSSVRGIINVGWYQKSSFPNFNFRMILHGTAGFLTSDLLRPNLYFHAAKEGAKNILRRLVGKSIRPLSYSEIFEAYYKELEHFFSCVREDAQPLISSLDGLEATKLIESIYDRSSRNWQNG